MSREPIYIFIHLAKCGGNTVRQALRTRFREEEIAWVTNEDIRAGLPSSTKVVGGHIHFGVHCYIERPCRYFTVLRHPVDRVISDYFYCLCHPNDTRNPLARRSSLMEWADKVGRSYMTGTLCWRSEEGARPEEVGFEQARSNLMHHFIHVGTLERLEGTLEWMAERFGCQRLELRKNENRHKPPIHYRAKDEIARQVAPDMPIYRWAKRLSARRRRIHEAEAPA